MPSDSPTPGRPSGLHAELDEDEAFWRDHQVWLQQCGYMLRPRYMPDWTPSWDNTKVSRLEREDGQISVLPYLIFDATRISDGAQVALKLIKPSKDPLEQETMTYFSTGSVASDPRNHCAPIYEALKVPDVDDRVILVMPLLRWTDDPPFETIGEVVDFFGQVIEGLQFMHEHCVAHRDCTSVNIMMDGAMYPDGFHPVITDKNRNFSGPARGFTRTERRPKYYFIDFGMSRRYRSEDMPILDEPFRGGDKTVPEFRNVTGLLNPFPTDVYGIGNGMRTKIMQVYRGLEFMEPLVGDMVQDDPDKRPTIDQISQRFSEIRAKLSSNKLRSRIAKREENIVAGLFRGIAHLYRRGKYTFRGMAADPGR
ncbi:hypothetical protein FIBSPDRAFT_772076 [Athelia psychrophila]|uniref:Protein kinase domain-containing protein n=1 Tax=Athelia psychrophila TaxID=1759441 RepID=A0A166X5J0_9AGAM|nr:hypothetical protein FIBSPDRAFT_772076 [Fibularhizoctonia sp. CBS 109695]